MVIAGCPDRHVPGEPFDTATTGDGDTSTSAVPVTGGEPPGTAGPTGPDPDPTTSETGPDPSSGTGSGDVATTLEPPASCGPPCSGVWTHEGPLVLNGGGGPVDYTCMRAILNGDLYIGPDADPSEIASLANLERVDGKFTIAGNGDLTDLASFGCLREVNSLTLTGMPQLESLDALANLRDAPRIVLDGLGIAALPAFAPEFAGVTSLILRNNPALVDLSAASAWGSDGGLLDLSIRNNAALPALTGLAGLLAGHGAAQVRIELADLPALASLAGLEPVVFADLHFERLPLVTDLAPLANLEVGGQITFNALHAVTDLGGLAGLTSVGNLTIGDCAHSGVGGMDGLVSLVGLDSLVVVGHLALADNDQLTSLVGAPLLSQMGGFAGVGNPKLSISDYEALLKQVEGDPWTCVGDWDRCQCSLVNPG